MRRRTLPLVALLTTLFLAACADSGPTTAGLKPSRGITTNLTLEDYIQQEIDALLPRGFEDAVDARWATVKDKFRAGDFEGAAKHLATLAMWIDKKTGEITPPLGETQGQAAVRLILNMTTWLYGDQSSEPVTELAGDDVTVEVVPAGTPFEVTTPSDHAGVGAGPQNEDRIIIISQELFPGKCNGPLPTERCQYPLFYHISSFPNEKLVGGGRFAICLVADPTDPRRPLDYPQDEVPGPGPVHERVRLAHNAPENPTTPGAYIEEDDIPGAIEVLPRVPAGEQTGFVTCESHTDASLRGPARLLHNVVHFAERIFRPKNAYAYDRGPEHRSDDFSFFNAIDPISQADLAVHSLSAPSSAFTNASISVSYTVDNVSRHFGGNALAASRATEAVTYLSSDATLDAGDVEKARVPIAAMAPDATPQSILQSVTMPSASGTYYLFVQVEESPGFGEVTLANNVAGPHAITVADPVVLETGFEDGDPAWTLSGLWRRSMLDGTVTCNRTGCLPNPLTGSWSLWYGNPTTGNFNVGTNSGTATSPQFTIPNVSGSVQLEFDTWWEIESVDPHAFDLMQVQLVRSVGVTVLRQLNPTVDQNGGALQPFTSAGFNVQPATVHHQIDLSAYKGEAVSLRFQFSSRDGNYNDFRGWIVDQVKVRALPGAAIRANVTDGSTVTPIDQLPPPERSPEP